MPDFNGDLVGTPLAAAAGANPYNVPNALKGGTDVVLMRDTIELITAFAQNDRVKLGDFPSDVIINPVQSTIWFDNLGASTTMDVGSTASEAALVAAQATSAAGSCLFYKNVDVANYWKPLWQVLGLAADPGGTIAIFAKLEAADPGVGTMTWQIVGQRRLA
ncbi:hypothetical protein [Phenylobacterium sp.]|jgi:hypothetical protein|uniref:hypothetical protein n=1 Tax=Phenylobacterium sp. TaxID=1871053 RepID=UPI0037C7DE9D